MVKQYSTLVLNPHLPFNSGIFYLPNNDFFFFLGAKYSKIAKFSGLSSFNTALTNLQTFVTFSSFKSIKFFFTHFRLSLINSKFFYSYIHLKGIGFKLYKSIKTNSLIINSGYNHYTKVTCPSFINIVVRKFYVLIYSNSSLHNYFVNVLRNVRYPDPYRAKGFRFKNQIVKLKIGKQR